MAPAPQASPKLGGPGEGEEARPRAVATWGTFPPSLRLEFHGEHMLAGDGAGIFLSGSRAVRTRVPASSPPSPRPSGTHPGGDPLD